MELFASGDKIKLSPVQSSRLYMSTLLVLHFVALFCTFFKIKNITNKISFVTFIYIDCIIYIFMWPQTIPLPSAWFIQAKLYGVALETGYKPAVNNFCYCHTN